MALQVEHEIHRRRASRNFGLLLVLVLFAALIFGLTIAKVKGGDTMKAWDHHMDNALLPQNNGGVPAPSATTLPNGEPRPAAPVAPTPATAP